MPRPRAPWWMFLIATAFFAYFVLGHYRTGSGSFWLGTILEPKLAGLGFALVIAFSRPYDPVARMGAWLLGTGSIYSFDPPSGVVGVWRALPVPLGGLLWIPQVSILLFPQILFSFFAIFPRSFFRTRRPWILIWAPALAELTRIVPIYGMIYHPERTIHLPGWIWIIIDFSFPAYIIAGLAVLIVNYRRLEDLNERRRVRVLVAGSVVSLLAALVTVMGFWGSMLGLGGPRYEFWFGRIQHLTVPLALAFPFFFAYAILRHRLFDIRIMIRRGLQYALARRLLLSLVPALGAILLLDLAMNREKPLVAILQARGWVYGVLAVLAFTSHLQRQRWLEALDRRFFRERYDAQRLLHEVVDEVRRAGSFDRVAPKVVAQIEAALHPQFAALLLRHPHEASYRSLASAPAGHAPPPLPADSKLAALLRLLGKPLEVVLTETSWLNQQLPHEETGFLRRARIELLVPIATATERTEALLALGPKRSEEPYSREDQDLLVAITSSLALLLEKPVSAPPRVSEAFEECPRCGACHDTGAVHCNQEGATLIPVHLPRLLAQRYRLERRLGSGGMGTVYEAIDTALERHVAVKVIRDDLVGSADTAERFRQEARVAASFAHPNVVTVYDFGVVTGTRAFLVMELLDGATLREELKRQTRLAAARVLEILRGVCAAVDAAHRRQLIHRDLKPENIFLVRHEQAEIAKVLDFGVAKFLPSTTQSTTDTGTSYLIGTLHYVAPEQLRGKAVQAAWDIWALAVLAYEMLTGVYPFAGETAAEYYGAVLAGHLTPVTSHLPESPARWQEFFQRVFALEPQRRPNSVRAFFSELEAALS